MCSHVSGVCYNRPDFNLKRAPDDDKKNHKIPDHLTAFKNKPPPADGSKFPNYGTYRS